MADSVDLEVVSHSILIFGFFLPSVKFNKDRWRHGEEPDRSKGRNRGLGAGTVALQDWRTLSRAANIPQEI